MRAFLPLVLACLAMASTCGGRPAPGGGGGEGGGDTGGDGDGDRNGSGGVDDGDRDVGDGDDGPGDGPFGDDDSDDDDDDDEVRPDPGGDDRPGDGPWGECRDLCESIEDCTGQDADGCREECACDLVDCSRDERRRLHECFDRFVEECDVEFLVECLEDRPVRCLEGCEGEAEAEAEGEGEKEWICEEACDAFFDACEEWNDDNGAFRGWDACVRDCYEGDAECRAYHAGVAYEQEPEIHCRHAAGWEECD